MASVDISGLRVSQVQVQLSPDRLAAHGIDARDHRRRPASQQRQRVGRYHSRGQPRRAGPGGRRDRHPGARSATCPWPRGLRLGDVAEVELAYPEQTSFAFLDGSEALSINVYKTSTANLLAVVDAVREELGAVRALPEANGLNVNIYFDSSEDVRKGLAELRNSGLLGGVLAVICVFLFLRRLRSTLLIAISIPVSVIVTFMIMYLSRQAGWTDLTLNIISLMGLILAIGMLVDASIVVIESVFRHHHDLNEDPRTAVMQRRLRGRHADRRLDADNGMRVPADGLPGRRQPLRRLHAQHRHHGDDRHHRLVASSPSPWCRWRRR